MIGMIDGYEVMMGDDGMIRTGFLLSTFLSMVGNGLHDKDGRKGSRSRPKERCIYAQDIGQNRRRRGMFTSSEQIRGVYTQSRQFKF